MTDLLAPSQAYDSHWLLHNVFLPLAAANTWGLPHPSAATACCADRDQDAPGAVCRPLCCSAASASTQGWCTCSHGRRLTRRRAWTCATASSAWRTAPRSCSTTRACASRKAAATGSAGPTAPARWGWERSLLQGPVACAGRPCAAQECRTAAQEHRAARSPCLAADCAPPDRGVIAGILDEEAPNQAAIFWCTSTCQYVPLPQRGLDMVVGQRFGQPLMSLEEPSCCCGDLECSQPVGSSAGVCLLTSPSCCVVPRRAR